MNLTTLSVDPEVAREKVREYRGLAVSQRRKEDRDFRRIWRTLGKGQPILDVAQAFRETGLNERGLPKLAMARADWPNVTWNAWNHTFYSGRRFPRSRVNRFDLPSSIFSPDSRNNGEVTVPTIPPKLRPKDALSGYWILFEAQDWKEYPADPFLLKPVQDYMYAVVAEWELTKLERRILQAITR